MDDNRESLSEYRLEKSLECIKASELMLENSLYSDSINRSYYSIFHAVRALLALEFVDRKKHSAVIAYFQEHYIKTGIFNKRFSDIIQFAFNVRQLSDYRDFYVFARKDAAEQLDNARYFYEGILNYIKNL